MKRWISLVLIIILLFSLSFTIFSCKKEQEEVKPRVSLNEIESVPIAAEDEFKEIYLENPNGMQNTYMDVDPNFVVSVSATTAYLGASTEDYVDVLDSSGQVVEDIIFEYPDNGSSLGILFNIKPRYGYEKGKGYTIQLGDNSGLKFYKKDETVRKILFTVKDEDKNILELNSSHPTYDIANVSHFEGYGDYDTYLLYKGEINEGVGDVIIFSGDVNGKNETIYIQILKKIQEGGLTKIYYKCPDCEDIFNNMNVHVDDKPLNMENDFVLNDVNDMAKQLLYSDYVATYVTAVAQYYDFIDKVYDFWKSAFIDFVFKPKGNGIELGVSLTFTWTFESGWRVTLSIQFEWEKTFTSSADCKIKSFLGVPYDVDMCAAVASDETFTFQVLVSCRNPQFDKEKYTKENPQDLSLAKAKEQVQNLKDKWADAKGMDVNKNKIVGDTLMLNIGYIAFYFGWVTLDIDLYVCCKLSFSATLGIAYKTSSHQVVINYSTASGNGDGGASPSEVNTKTVNVSLAGNFSAEFFLKIRISLYITGLKWLANIAVDFDAGLYLNVSGVATFYIDFGLDLVGGDAGATLEFGLFFRVSLNVNILWFVHAGWTLYQVKAPIIYMGTTYNVNSMKSTAPIELSNEKTDIVKTYLLTFNVFDSTELGIISKTFKYNEKVTYFESYFFNKKKQFNVVESITSNVEGVYVEDNYIVVHTDKAELSGEFTVKVHSSVDNVYTGTIPFHYISRDAKYISFDGKDRTAYLPGDVVSLNHDPEQRDNYLFKGWLFGGEVHSTSETILMPDFDTNLEPFYVKDEYYHVRFYDYNNNLIKDEIVRAYDNAISPTMDEIDAVINSGEEKYHFVTWDKSLEHILQDTNVYAICNRKGEVV